MKRGKKIVTASVILALAVFFQILNIGLFTGCESKSDKEFREAKEKLEQGKKQKEDEEEEKKRDEKTEKEDEEKEKAEIQKVAEEFSKLWCSADYKTHQGNEWFHLYSKERLQFAEEIEEQKRSVDSVNNAKAVTTYEGIENEKIEFIQDSNKVKYESVVNTKIKEGTEEFLNSIPAKTEDTIKFLVQYEFIKEDGK